MVTLIVHLSHGYTVSCAVRNCRNRRFVPEKKRLPKRGGSLAAPQIVIQVFWSLTVEGCCNGNLGFFPDSLATLFKKCLTAALEDWTLSFFALCKSRHWSIYECMKALSTPGIDSNNFRTRPRITFSFHMAKIYVLIFELVSCWLLHIWVYMALMWACITQVKNGTSDVGLAQVSCISSDMVSEETTYPFFYKGFLQHPAIQHGRRHIPYSWDKVTCVFILGM